MEEYFNNMNEFHQFAIIAHNDNSTKLEITTLDILM